MPSRSVFLTRLVLGLAGCLIVTNCGRRNDDDAARSGTDDDDLPPVNQSDDAVDDRVEAATQVAGGEDCATNRPFYWEVGDAEGRLASGSVPAEGNSAVYEADTSIEIASASKWLYASYVVERNQGTLSEEDVRHLTLRSGYASFLACLPRDTVGGCMDRLENGTYDASLDGVFYYGGGHMQAHAILLGLGDLDAQGLASEVRSQLGTDIALDYSLPEPSGGASMTPAQYGAFLRKMLSGELRMGAMLGTDAVCASPESCPDDAVMTAAPRDEVWKYSLGHWVESDPDVGDGAFSSLGLFGFYPWIDSSSTWYGLVATEQLSDVVASLECGRSIRAAWVGAE
jgi:hypothetical protein